jgi:DNA-binding CsgD family transcriptional regulator
MRRRGRPPHPELLTPRQQEVLHLLRDGLTNDEIAARLGISSDGAKWHVSEILGKLGVSSRQEAARWDPADVRRRWGLVSAPLALMAKANIKIAAQAAGAIFIGASVVATAVLAWGVISTHGGLRSPDRIQPDRLLTARGVPLLDPGNTQILSYDPRTGELLELPVPDFEPALLAPDGSRIVLALPGADLTVVTLDGTQHQVDRTAAGAWPTDWSADGERMLWVGGNGLTILELSTGAATPLLNGNIQDAVWSPDERRVAFVRDQRLGVLDIESGNEREIAPHLTATYLPNAYGNGNVAWSPDGETIAFTHWTVEEPVTQGRSDIYVIAPDGSGLRQLTDSPRAKRYLAFSSDSRHLAYLHSSSGDSDVRIADLTNGRVLPVVGVTSQSMAPSWISDEALLASNYHGVWLVQADGTVRNLIPTVGQCQRHLLGWDGQRIFFRNGCYGGN